MADFVKEMNEKYSEYEEERKRKHKQSIWRAIFTDLFYIKKRMLSLRHTVVQVKKEIRTYPGDSRWDFQYSKRSNYSENSKFCKIVQDNPSVDSTKLKHLPSLQPILNRNPDYRHFDAHLNVNRFNFTTLSLSLVRHRQKVHGRYDLKWP